MNQINQETKPAGKRIALVVDSLSNPTADQKSRFYYEVVPATVIMDGKNYRDFIDITANQVYEYIEKNPDAYATAAPTPGAFQEAYRKISQSGINEIVCITLTKKLSATWNSARIAKEAIKSELPQLKIEVIDSELAGAGANALCLVAGKMAEDGKSIEEISRFIEDMKKKVNVYVLLDTIRYLHRSGRIPEVASKIGSVLPFKPIVHFSEGTLHLFSASISREGAIKKLFDILQKNIDKDNLQIGLMHAQCPEDAEALREKIMNTFPSSEVSISEISPILGYVIGTKTVLLSFWKK